MDHGLLCTMLTTDILVLGSGLSGLRAAWSAKQTDPTLKLTVASMRHGPSGSSFTNQNNALGYQLLDTDNRKETFVRETLASPGFIDENLVNILAQESADRFHDMTELNLCFRLDTDGQKKRFTGCGSRDPRAIIFDDLPHTFNQYLKKTNSYGCTFLTNTEILGILTVRNTAVGAWGINKGSLCFIQAKTIIMALGGPAPLFTHNIAGAANPGLSYGVLADCGTNLANTAFLQFMWADRTGAFASPATLLAPGNTIERTDGTLLSSVSEFGDTLPALRDARRTHCPVFYEQADTRLDLFLWKNRWADGFTRITTEHGSVEVALHAHAGNGGAIIDENGETSLRNLFALGECATGMHGANRIGGAMVLATQVFGHRAGVTAAIRAKGIPLPSRDIFDPLTENISKTADVTDPRHAAMHTIQQVLNQRGLLDRRRETEAFRSDLAPLLKSQNRRTHLAAITARTLLFP